MPRSAPFAGLPWQAMAGLLAMLAGLVGCANPVPPGGGPRDQEPPRIAASRPEAEATNVEGRSVGIQFSEYVDRASLREALTVTPAPPGRLEFDWDQRSVEIAFPEPFRDSTTYLLTIDKALEDLRGVALEEPITLAFSTGDQIDQGRLAGRVIGDAQGQGREGFDVYAYDASAADSVGLPEAPLYRTQTGPDGTFQFSYLSEDARYYVVALRDRNRNYRADPLEAFAVPPRRSLSARPGAAPLDSARRPALPADTSQRGAGAADTTQTDTTQTDMTKTAEAPWVVGARDPVPPRLTRAIPLSRRRVALRFSEPVRLQSRAAKRYAIRDTTAGRRVSVASVYRRPGQQQRLTLRTSAAMQSGAGHRARLREGETPVVTDTSGNAPERPAAAVFTVPEQADTSGLRFLGFSREGPPLPAPEDEAALALAPGQAAAVQFNQPLGPDSAAARQLVSARDTSTGNALPLQLETDDGTTYRARFVPRLDSGQVARLRVDGARLRPPADTVYTRLVRRLPPSALGAVSGAVRVAERDTASVAARDSAAADSAQAAPPVVVELYAAESPGGLPLRTTRADSSGAFLFRNLPAASYRFRAFLDRDADGAWDAGRLAPYRRAEPLTWSRQPVEARPRWETAAGDTLRIANFQF